MNKPETQSGVAYSALLYDDPRFKQLSIANTTASWAVSQLKILAEMAEDHKLPDWYVREVRRIHDGIKVV